MNTFRSYKYINNVTSLVVHLLYHLGWDTFRDNYKLCDNIFGIVVEEVEAYLRCLQVSMHNSYLIASGLI